GCKYSTIGLVIPYYHDLLDVLEKYIKDCSDLIVKEAIKKARTKLNKYYSDANSLVYIIGTKRAFLAAKELITSRRCNLNPTTIRACMCLKEWQKINNN
ncbi:14788_t:CDS:2, partial [Cetraspora pellucida]